MYKKGNHFILWLLSFFLCFSSSYSMITAEEETVPEEEPEMQKVIEEPQKTEEEVNVTEDSEKNISEKTPEPIDEGDQEVFPEEAFEEVLIKTSSSDENADEWYENLEEAENNSDLFDTDGNFTYSINNGNVTITGYSGNDIMLEIPSIIDGYPVTVIGAKAFESNSYLQNIIIPNSINTIEGAAFYGCKNLQNIEIPNGVVSIKYNAFTLCQNLQSVVISATVLSIDSESFRGCSSLTSIIVSDDNPNYDSRNNSNAIIETSTNTLICGCEKTVVPDSVVRIGDWAFSDCVNLNNVDLPDGVISIGNGTFAYCSNLKSITFPDSVTSIGTSAFVDCDSLINVKLPQQLECIEPHTFSSCDNLTNVIIPNTVVSIKNHAFDSCTSLQAIIIPDSVTFIGDGVFLLCRNLKDIFYMESEEQWKEATKNSYSYLPEGVTLHFNSCGPEQTTDTPIIVIPGIMGTELYDYEIEDLLPWHKIWVDDRFYKIAAVLEEYGPNFTNDTVGVAKQPVETYITPLYKELPEGSPLNKVVRAALIKEENNPVMRMLNSEYGTIDTYKVLIEALFNEFPERDIYFYAYDWRKSNIESAESLSILINMLDIEKADILAHSMGGLVLSQFVEQGHEDMISHCITFGTPYEGANKLLRAVLTTASTGTILDPLMVLGGLDTNVKKTFDGVTELSPTEDYISYEDGAYRDYLYNDQLSEVIPDKSKKIFFRKDQFDLTAGQNQLIVKPVSGGIYKVSKGWLTKMNPTFVMYNDSKTFQTWLSNIKNSQSDPAELKVLENIIIEPTGSGKAAGYNFYPEYRYYTKKTLRPVDYSAVLKSLYGSQGYEKIKDAQISARNGYQKLQSMDNAYFAIGIDKWTLTGLSMMRNNDGIIEYVDCVSNESGDGTVPFYSANQLNSNQHLHNATYYELTHGGLVGDEEEKNDQYSTEWPKVKAWMFDILNGTNDNSKSSASEQFGSESVEPVTKVKTLRFEGDVEVTIRSGEEYLSNSEESFCGNASFGCMDILGATGNILVFSIDEGTEYTVSCNALDEGVIDFTEKLFEDGEVISSVNYPAIIVEQDSEITIQDDENTPIISIDYEKDGTSDLIIDSTVVEYNIRSAYSEGGNVGPNESYYVSEGADTSLTIAADEDYCISYILINGEMYSEAAVNGLTEYTLSFENVNDNYNVYVQFGKIGEPDLTDIGDVLLEDVPADGIIPEGIWIAGIKNQVYTGSAIKQNFRVYDGKTLLKEKADYTVTYKNTTNAYTFQGTDQDHPTANDKKKAPQIIIKSNSKGNYKGSRTVYFSIEPVNIETDGRVYIENEITLKETTKVQRPVPVITFNGKTVSSKEYTLTYLDSEGNVLNRKTGPKTAGTYMIRIEGNNKNFTGTKEIRLTVSEETNKQKAVALSKAITITTEAAEYDGTVKETALFANKAGYELTEGTDYTAVYTKNVNAGTATVTATGKGIYTGTVKKTFKITPRLYADHADEFRFDVSDAVYSKGGAIPEVHVYWNNKELKAGTDYTLKYANNKKVTDEFVSKWPTVTITFKGNFKGSITKDFFIEPKPLSAVTITAKDKVYSAKANTWKSAPVLTDTDGKTLKAGTDYEKTVTYTTVDDEELPAVAEAGTIVKVTVTGKGNYTGEISTTYRILDTGKDISKMTFKIANQEYTGSPVTIDEGDISNIKLGKSEQGLVLGRDYEIVGYINNINKGTAKVTFRGKDGYGGTKTVSFKIGQRSIVDYWNGVKSFFSKLMN